MVMPADEYIPIALSQRLIVRAWKAWAIGFTVVLVWVILILAPPILKANGIGTVSSALYQFFSYLCHQIDGRSFHIAGEPFGVCTRCFGVYLGLVAGFVIYPFWRNIGEVEPLPKFWLIVSLVPITVDWSLTFFNIWQNTDISRFVTGLIVGIACATFIVPAIVEISRNIGRRAPNFR